MHRGPERAHPLMPPKQALRRQAGGGMGPHGAAVRRQQAGAGSTFGALAAGARPQRAEEHLESTGSREYPSRGNLECGAARNRDLVCTDWYVGVSGNGQKAQSIPPSNRADVLNYLCTIDELVARLPGNL